MINLIQKGQKYKMGDVFPLINVPVNSKGKQVEFTDFQWWAPTDKWEAWLKANPRSWQAESEDYSEEKRKLYESLVEKKEIDPLVLDFEKFNSILEDEETVQPSSVPQANPEAKKSYTKFVFAYNKLMESGKMKGELDSNTLQKGSTYAIVADIPDTNNQPVVETRQAYKMKIVSDLANGYLAFCDETIPFGKLPESSEDGNSGIIEKISQWGFGLAAGGVALTSVVGAVKLGSTGIKALATKFGWRKATEELLKKGAQNLTQGAGEAAAKQVAQNATRVAATELELATGIGAEQLGVSSAAAATTGTEAAATGLAASEAGGAAAGLSAGATVAIVAAAVVAAWEIGQRIYNFTSDKQAPRLGEIEDEGWARDMFMPGTIADGDQITVCWTQSAGNNWFEDLLWNEDTRTTMDLVKLGNFNGKAVFILIRINSKEFEAILKSKEMVLLSFDAGVKVERGYLDNDELEFEMIEVEKGDQKLIAGLIFQGVCPWEDMEGAYKGSDDTFIGVPENAPEEYTFHFKYGKGDKDVNVTGTLIRDLDSMDGMKELFKFSGSGGKNESENYDRFIEALAESSGVLSFSDFSKVSRGGISNVFEEDSPGAASAPTPSSDPNASADPAANAGENKEYFTQTSKVAAYEVKLMEYADLGLQGQDLPSLDTFVVPNNYLEAKDQESIDIDPMQEVDMKYPKRGTVIVESEPIPDPVPVSAEGDQPEGGVPVTATKDEVINTYKDRPEVLNKLGIKDVEKIKDKDKKDEISFLDVITPEEKEKLGMPDWDFIRKVKIYKDGKTGEPIMVKFKGEGKKRKFKASDEDFSLALKVAERIQAGYKNAEEGIED